MSLKISVGQTKQLLSALSEEGMFCWCLLNIWRTSFSSLYTQSSLSALMHLSHFLSSSFWLHLYAFSIRAASLCVSDDDDLDLKCLLCPWILSGSDTGIGHALAKYLDNLGFTVFAGVLNKDGPGAEELRRTCSQRLSLLQLDITNPTQVKEAYLQVSEKVQNTGTAFVALYGILICLLPVGFIVSYVRRLFPPQSLWQLRHVCFCFLLFSGLWGVVNNAGILGFLADGELLPMNTYRQCMEVNFFGAVEVSKTFLPLLRKSQGRLVNMSSMTGELSESTKGGSGTAGKAIEVLGISAEEDVGWSRS